MQAITENRFKQNISQGREREREREGGRERQRELHNVQFFQNHMDSPFKNCMAPALRSIIHILVQGNTNSQYLSIEILNILYDGHGPNLGFWCLMSFEHLNSDT